MAKSKWIVVSSCTAALLTAGSLTAQSPQTPANRAPVTVVGCVLRDSAYRPTSAVRNSSTEFLLVSAVAPANAVGAVGTAGEARGGKATFGLIGKQEPQLGQYVGRRVEVVGTIETDARDSQQPTGGATDPVSGAGAPPGVPAATRGSSTPAAPPTASVPRLNILSVKPASGAC